MGWCSEGRPLRAHREMNVEKASIQRRFADLSISRADISTDEPRVEISTRLADNLGSWIIFCL